MKRTLDTIAVDEPCTVDWDTMLGSGAVRYCRLCKKNVYDLSDLTRAEGEALVFESEGTPCVRFHRRADGTVMTADCAPTRADRARRAGRRAMAMAAAVLAAGLGGVMGFRWEGEVTDRGEPKRPSPPDEYAGKGIKEPYMMFMGVPLLSPKGERLERERVEQARARGERVNPDDGNPYGI